PGPLCGRRLPGGSQSCPLHAGAGAAAEAPPARPVSRPAGRTTTRTPPGLCGPIRPPCRRRRDLGARHAGLRVALGPVGRSGETPSPAGAHCGGKERRACGPLVNRDAAGEHPALVLCLIAGTSRLMRYLAAICQRYHTWEGLLV